MDRLFPICFASARDFERWRTSAGARDCGHCHDCTPTYQLRMKKQRRCEHPEVMFSVDVDGGVHGVTSFQPRARKQDLPRSPRWMSPDMPPSRTVA